MRLLVVEDSALLRKMFGLAFPHQFNELGQAENGKQAIELLAASPERFDAVLLDLRMPDMNGIEFIRALRGLDKTKETPILMVTTNAAKDDIVEALRAGVNNYIVKPFTPDTFKEKIEAVTAR